MALAFYCLLLVKGVGLRKQNAICCSTVRENPLHVARLKDQVVNTVQRWKIEFVQFFVEIYLFSYYIVVYALLGWVAKWKILFELLCRKTLKNSACSSLYNFCLVSYIGYKETRDHSVWKLPKKVSATQAKQATLISKKTLGYTFLPLINSFEFWQITVIYSIKRITKNSKEFSRGKIV